MELTYFNSKTLQHYGFIVLQRYGIIAILLVGFMFRIWGLGSAEIFHDEGIYAFRSIGYIDYIQNDDQTTPMQWFKNSPTLPWWTKLSFHDAPPLFFLVQHLFFRTFGDSLFVARLPSLIAGLFAIWLVYLIGNEFQKQITTLHFLRSPQRGSLGVSGFALPASQETMPAPPSKPAQNSNLLFENNFFDLLAAFLLSINHIHIWLSRSSIIESLLITLILANMYFFLRMLDSQRADEAQKEAFCKKLLFVGRSWFWFGLTLGLAFLTKYTAALLLPVYALYIVLFRRDLLHSRQWWYAILLALIIFSPVIFYNIKMYQAVGHFDLQIAYLLGQETPEWRASLGKVQEQFSSFIPNVLAVYSPLFLLGSVSGFFVALRAFTQKAMRPAAVFLIAGVVSVTFLLFAIGSAFRFLALYLPFAVFLVAGIFMFLHKLIPQKIIFSIILVGFVIWEIWFTVGGIFIEYPRLGAVELDRYLSDVLGETTSKTLPQSTNLRLDAVVQRFAKKIPAGDQQKIIVYDENTIISPRLWIFTRRFYYHGVPALTVGQFRNLLRERGPEYFTGYTAYFVKTAGKTAIANSNFFSPDAGDLEQFLRAQFQLSPEIIFYGNQLLPTGGFARTPMFSVYKIIL